MIFIFSQKKCNPCEVIKKFITSHTTLQEDIDFKIIDVEKNPKLVKKYLITSVPTTLDIQNEIVVQSFTGITSQLFNFLRGKSQTNERKKENG